MKIIIVAILMATQDKRQVEISSEVKLELQISDAAGSSKSETSTKTFEKYTEEKSGDKTKVKFVEHPDKDVKNKTFTIDGDKVLNDKGERVKLDFSTLHDIDNMVSALKGIELKKDYEWGYQLSANSRVLSIDSSELPKIKCKIKEVAEKSATVFLSLEAKGLRLWGTLSVRRADLKPLALDVHLDLEAEQSVKDKVFDQTKNKEVDQEIAKVQIKSRSIKTTVTFTY